MPAVHVFDPRAVLQSGEGPDPGLEQYPLQFLAQGDSWFSIGSVIAPATTNLFDGLSLPVGSCAINCALPGAKLSRMTDTSRQRTFLQLLNGPAARRWSGLLFSGGGNDLIEAAQSGPEQLPEKRLLATADEWRELQDGRRYLSDAGWDVFVGHLTQVFHDLLAERDRRPVNRGVPIVVHTYDVPTPRNAGLELGPGGPWLFPAMKAFGIPEDDWTEVAKSLLERLRTLLLDIAAGADGSLHVVDTLGFLIPAHTGDTGPTEDWQNEIHPSSRGYRKLSAVWGPALSAIFGAG